MYIITTKDENLVQIREEHINLKASIDRMIELLGCGYTKLDLHNTELEKS